MGVEGIVCDVPLAEGAVERMGGWADAEVGDAAPIVGIMDCVVIWQGEV